MAKSDAPDSRPTKRLYPQAIATRLFGLAPDRDERAAQICQEALLTLAANGFEEAGCREVLSSPKRERFALRSLALGVNFLAGRQEERARIGEMTAQLYGERLSSGEELPGSSNLSLARDALEGLIDPDTRKGQPGGWLMLPFHESLLWYDARRRGASGQWGVRRVWMRGSGITLARLLADPPDADDETRRLGRSAIEALREVLTPESPLASVAGNLESALDEADQHAEDTDQADWARGAEPRLRTLAGRLCRHAEGIMRQEGASGPAKLWQLRSVLALDLAVHALGAAWEATGTPPSQQYLLLSFAGPPRPQNRVRQRSETSFDTARLLVQEAILQTLARAMAEAAAEPDVQWHEEFLSREDQLSDQIGELEAGSSGEDLDRIAREVIAIADYGRPVGGFRGLLQTAGLVAGTGQYRYFAPAAELLEALVGALSRLMPMDSDGFFEAIFREWHMVVDQRNAAQTALGKDVDGAELERNARRAETQLVDSGLALGLSDRTTVVGERTRRKQ